METLWHDLRYSLRKLINSPAFTIVAVFTLAVGIGVNTAVFSIVNQIFLSPLPAQNPDELVVLTFNEQDSAAPLNFSYPDFRDTEGETRDLAELFAYQVGLDGFSVDHRAERIVTSFVTGNYFSALGIKPALGRLILPAEGNIPGSSPVLVLGYSYWKQRFNGNPGVLDKKVLVDGQVFSIIGVAAEDFHGLFSVADMQVYLPLNTVTIEHLASDPWQNRDARNLYVAARLKPGGTIKGLQAKLNVVAARLGQKYPQTNQNTTVQVFPEREERLQPNPVPHAYNTEVIVAGLFLALSGLVLLLASLNVANILLVRAVAREREMATRVALGAQRIQLIRQLLTESLVLAFFGGIGGIALGQFARMGLRSIQLPTSFPIHLDFGFDYKVFVFAFAVALITGIIVGLFPAIRASKVDIREQLIDGGRGASGRKHKLRNFLVAAQVAGSLVLLIVAGLFTRSLQQTQNLKLGFDPQHLLNLSVDPQQVGYDEERSRGFYIDLLARVRSLPGVESASLAFSVPMGSYTTNSAIQVDGQPVAPGEHPPIIPFNIVSTDYFKTLGIPLSRGRAFLESDNRAAQAVAVVNEAMAVKFWSKKDAVGQRFSLEGDSSHWIQVVGVARDSKTGSLLDRPHSYFFLPTAQQYISLQTLQLHTAGDPLNIAPSVERQIHELSPDLPVFDVQTMGEALNNARGFFIFHLGASFAWVFGCIGLTLAIVGVYGVASQVASEQTFEIGIRVALGAQRSHVRTMVLRKGLITVALGVVAGLLLAVVLTRGMSGFLVGITSHDPVTYFAAVSVLAAVAFVACYLPARRAMLVDPSIILH